jgi:uncharacterized membrane protein
MTSETEKRSRTAPRYLLLGLLTVAPLWVTWLVFDFVFTQLSATGGPWVERLADAIAGGRPELAQFLERPAFQSSLAVVLTLVVLYLIGWVASNVIGRRIIDYVEGLVLRMPGVGPIYGGTKRFLASIREKPGGLQRVVLIRFPTADMKALGLVTRVITDVDTGRELAAVYVPTAPNPTSGYIELVPVEDVVATDWTMDEAMSFVMTGGATSPEHVRFHTPAELDRLEARESADATDTSDR